MRVALMATDKPDSLHVRMDARPKHVAYLKASDAVEQAGPFLSPDGEMCGSLIILQVADMAEAEDFAANDPYAKAGLFESVVLQEWNRVIG